MGCLWSYSRSQAGKEQRQIFRKYSLLQQIKTIRSEAKVGTSVFLSLLTGATRFRAAGGKAKQNKSEINSAHEEINLWLKVMCWQSGICWLLSDTAELGQWINDFFSILLHLSQPLPSFIIASLLCYSDWQKGNKLYPAGVFRRNYLFPRNWILDLVGNSYFSQQFMTLL